jgi:hypothetical protein
VIAAWRRREDEREGKDRAPSLTGNEYFLVHRLFRFFLHKRAKLFFRIFLHHRHFW